jgi:CheY-like chemotaxis protein
VPITVTAPDLIVTGLTAPSPAVLGDTVPISWTVKNQGAVDALANWKDRLYLSDTPNVDPINPARSGATFVQEVDAKSTLMAGASYTQTKNVFLPSTKPGNRYLVVVANGDDAQGETDRQNNTFAVPIMLTAPDLTVTAATAPTTAVLGGKIAVSYTVKNLGSVPAKAKWYDAVYVSDTPAVGDRSQLINAFPVGNNSPLGAGQSYTATHNVTLPDTATGPRYLVFVTDYQNAQGETAKTNNSFAVPITLSAPDLTVVTASAPATAVPGGPLTVSYTVKNQGSVPAPAQWTDAVYLSSVPYVDDRAILVDRLSAADQSPLGAGQSYMRTRTFTVPNAAVNAQYLLFVTDVDDDQPETDKTNNLLARPISLVTPDLTVVTATAPAMAVVGNKDSIAISWTVKNQGTVPATASWSDAVYVSSKNVFDTSAMRLQSYSESSHAPLAPNATYTENRTLTLDNMPAGSRYLLFVTNADNGQPETDKSNNFFAVPITLTKPDVDLVIMDAMAPATAAEGQSIPISYTVKNQGTATARVAWFDYLYLSDSRTHQADDTYVAFIDDFSHVPLAGNASFTVRQNVTVPAGKTGSRYLVFVINSGLAQGETDETNDVVALPIMVTAPDLTVTMANAPSSAVLNQTIPVTWTVKNQGTVPAAAKWYDAIYLSNSTLYDYSATLLGSVYESDKSPLAAGNSYSVTKNVTIPNTQTGDRFLLIVTDINNNQGETDKTNNVYALPIHLSAPDADLVVTNVTAPTTAVEGDTIQVSWTVKNQGALQASGTWSDAVYYSDHPALDGTAQFITSFTAPPSPPLLAGASYMLNENVLLPRTATGSRYLLVVTNYLHQQSETDYSNNVFAVPITLTAADLAVTNALGPAVADLGDTISVSWTVKNQGSEFVVRLPILVRSPGLGISTNGDHGPSASGAARRVLIVDDNVDGAESLGLMLQMAGHEVSIVHDGLAAVETALAFRPDVVLLDIGLPGMNGYEVARRLREQPELAGTLLVALTGYGQEEDRQRCREAGIHHHLVKPVDPPVLTRLLARGLESVTVRAGTEAL